jgi:hypothetical protein
VLSFFWADAHKEQEQAQTRRIHPALTTGRAAHSIEAKAVIRIEVAVSSSMPLPVGWALDCQLRNRKLAHRTSCRGIPPW